MRIVTVLILLIVAAACTNPPAAEPGPVRAFEFRAIGQDTPPDTLLGTAFVGRQIRVVVRSGVLHPAPRWVPKAPSAGLAYAVGAKGWDMRAESKRVALTHVHFHGDSLADSVIFVISRPAAPLPGHWIVIQEYGDMTLPGVRGVAMQETRTLQSAEHVFPDAAP